MNQEQQLQYSILLSLPAAVFDQWLDRASPEELALADSLFSLARFDHLDRVDSVETARQLLKQFTLKG